MARLADKVDASALGAVSALVQTLSTEVQAMRGVDGAVAVHEFRRVCSGANLTSCIPICNQSTYGYLLSIEIDSRGTVLTCNKYDGTFSWQGQASLGGYIGSDFDSFSLLRARARLCEKSEGAACRLASLDSGL